MATRGRHTKYTPDTVKRLTDAVALGATYELACRYAGIGHETFSQWMRNKPEFSEAVKAAEGKAVVGWLATIEKAAREGTWQAAAWKLERLHSDVYGQKLTMKLQPEWIAKLAKVGLTPGDAMEQLIQAIEADHADGE